MLRRELSVLIGPEHAGISIAAFARRQLGFSARSLKLQKQTEKGILLNGEPAFVTRILSAGDRLVFTLPREHARYPSEPGELDILLETGDFLAVNKPAGMPVHPSPGHDRDSLLNRAAWYFGQTGDGCLFRPLYRLDKDTSGVLLLAKHHIAAGARLQKEYLAVCGGGPMPTKEGEIALPIGLEEGSKIKRCCRQDGEPARTRWRLLGERDGHSLLSLRLDTGRTHQIRVHLSTIGHALAGDDLYGGSRERISRQALHCAVLRLSHPALLPGEIVLRAALPADIAGAFPWITDCNSEKEETQCLPV